jgi:hypothetical protein
VPLEDEGLVLRVGVEDWEEDLALLVEDNALVGAFLEERALEEEEVLVLVLVLVSELRSQGLALRVLGVVPDELLAADAVGRDELVFVFGIFRIYEEMVKENKEKVSKSIKKVSKNRHLFIGYMDTA